MREKHSNFHIAGLIGKYLKGEITAKEEQMLRSWRAEAEANEQLWRRLTDKQYIGKRMKGWEQKDAADSWAGILQRIDHPAPPVPVKKVSLFRKKGLRIAAALVPLFILGGILFYDNTFRQKDADPTSAKNMTDRLEPNGIKPEINRPPGDKNARLVLSDGRSVGLTALAGELLTELDGTRIRNKGGKLTYLNAADRFSGDMKLLYNSVITPKGGEYQLTLADGTRVWLNAASSLRFPTRFTGRERRVFVSGEAYFEVAEDPDHPFVVHTRKSAIRVLGTKFNVKSYPDEPADRTSLLEGSVRISLRNGKEQVLLQPGFESVIRDQDEIRVGPVSMEEALAWKNGLFIFRNESLESIMRKLSRWYDVNIVFNDPELRNYHFTGRVKRYENLQSLLQLIETTARVRFVMKDDRLVVIKP